MYANNNKAEVLSCEKIEFFFDLSKQIVSGEIFQIQILIMLWGENGSFGWQY